MSQILRRSGVCLRGRLTAHFAVKWYELLSYKHRESSLKINTSHTVALNFKLVGTAVTRTWTPGEFTRSLQQRIPMYLVSL